MSPSPDRSSPSSKPPLPDEIPPMTEQPSAASDATPTDASPAKEAALDQSSDVSANSAASTETAPLVPKRPLMRPVSRPQPPAPPPVTPAPVEVVSKPPKPEVAPTPVESTPAVVAADADSGQALIRQQPIPPPSEPKQYRAIGLVRGRYTPSEEQFTRGAMITSEGTEVEAVLLGRVMSLVRNHLDLEQEHLWVVYPRTREMRQDLHVQIVGVWEPEKLNKNAEGEIEDEPESEAETDDASETATPVDTSPSSAASNSPAEDSGFDENYFSIRGEVVFYSAEEGQIVVKIQQAPRKTADREKAFKLRLDGTLNSPKALGYFWDLQVERRQAALVVTSGTAIGLVPPKKKTAGASAGLKRGGDRRPPQRKARPVGARSAAPTGAPRREPLPKPVKRTEPASDS
ncbi:hypothetical protein [Stenomitos frigidus]|uniref:Uncharacterized protein n=1 Tax=Stenomitos frigidus ULC18 TaxID=2107698 RepID=A0A2T1ENU1_9CYAN|nr:hypothetical protein [Stenomitos frigidus]PSB34328.1 hypothetical protein C7B82_02330 [Stenomitos frigidus ULC18]